MSIETLIAYHAAMPSLTIAQALQLASEDHRAGRLNDAESLYRQVLNYQPASAEAHFELGHTLKDKGDLDGAIQSFAQAAGLRPDLAVAHNNLGTALREKGRLDESLAAYARAAALAPNEPQIQQNRGAVLLLLGRFDEALAAFGRVIELRPDFAGAYDGVGSALQKKWELHGAMDAYRKSIELRPDNAGTWNELGNVLRAAGEVDEAVAAYRRSLAIRPDFHTAAYNLAQGLILKGDFEQGFGLWQARLKVPELYPDRRFSQPMWDGSDLDGRRILINAEQGLGDMIFAARYAPLLASGGGRVIWETWPELRRLMESQPGIHEWATTHQPAPPFDVYCPMMSLPSLFKTTLATIPVQSPYLYSDPGNVEQWRGRLALEPPGLKVGLAWAGNPQLPEDAKRSLPLSLLAPLAQVRGVRFYSLQKGEAGRQAHDPPPGMELTDWTDELHDLADTAALVQCLDLIISVDSVAAHLAGALGRDGWVLQRFAPDWRWLLGRDDSPWYPTLRLFRQPRLDDWQSVVEVVARELGAKAGASAASVAH